MPATLSGRFDVSYVEVDIRSASKWSNIEAAWFLLRCLIVSSINFSIFFLTRLSGMEVSIRAEIRRSAGLVPKFGLLSCRNGMLWLRLLLLRPA